MTGTVSIFNVLAEDTANWLNEQLNTNIADDSKAGLVQAGLARGMANPYRIVVLVKTGDAQWRHTSNMSSQNVGMVDVFGEVGGGLHERLRFIVEYTMIFGPEVDQTEARAIANVVLSRVRYSLSNRKDDGTWWFTITEDDFMEHASRVFVYDSFLTEGGSEGKWQWRGETRLEFLTERTGCV